MRFKCAHCGKEADKPAAHINRARKAGLRLFCGRRCFGLGRRKHKTKAQRVEEKRLYDAEYRRRNRAMLKAKKHSYFVQTYDPAKARVERKKRAKAHAEYCRRPEYKAYKHRYDAERYAAAFGEFSEAYKALKALNETIEQKVTDYEIRLQNQTYGKAQRRRREAGIPERNRRGRHSSAHG